MQTIEQTGSDSPDRGLSGRHQRWLIALGALLISRAVSTLALVAYAIYRKRPEWGSTGTLTLFGNQHVVGARGAVGLWDSFWYLNAAEHGWPHHPIVSHYNTTGFFPALPLSIRAVHGLTGLSWTASGVAADAIFEIGAVIAVATLAHQIFDHRAANRAVVLFCVFPGTYVFSLIYSEPLFILFAATCLIALHRRWWWIAGLAAALSGATRPTGVVVMVCCAWVAQREIRARRDWRSLIAPLFSPVGMVAYLGFLWVRTGSPLSYSRTQTYAWGQRLSLMTVPNEIRAGLSIGRNDVVVIVLVFAVVALVLLALQVRAGAVPSEWLVFAFGCVLISVIPENVGLKPRFAMLAFPMILGLGARLQGRIIYAVVAGSVILLAVTSFTASGFTP